MCIAGRDESSTTLMCTLKAHQFPTTLRSCVLQSAAAVVVGFDIKRTSITTGGICKKIWKLFSELIFCPYTYSFKWSMKKSSPITTICSQLVTARHSSSLRSEICTVRIFQTYCLSKGLCHLMLWVVSSLVTIFF